MTDHSLPSYHKTLLRYVALFIFIPVLALFSFIYMSQFKDNLENAETIIAQHGNALTSDMRAKLSELRNQIYKLVSHRAVAEVPINILYSQNAQISLQQFTDRNPLVEKVFIQDDKGFIIEGWPISVLAFRSEVLEKFTLEAMQSNVLDAEIRMLWLLPEQYQMQTINAPAVDNRHQLIYSMPLYAETDSIIEPYRATGTLNVLIDLAALTQHEVHNTSLGKHNLQLIANGFPLFEQQKLNIKQPLEQSFKSKIQAQHYAGTTPVEVTLQYDKGAWTSAFWTQTTKQVAPLLLFFPFMIWGLFRFTKNFKKPINQMVEMCRNLASGNYSTEEPSVSYQEFDLLYRRMNNMAKTIASQIKSLEEARSKAEKSEKIKSQFLANMSHEIRTPMNGVLGMLQLMEQEELSDNQKERVNIAKTSAQNLLQIINDILDISKIEANKIQIEQISCNIAELVQHQTDSMQPMAKEKDNVLKALIKPPFHCFWLTDPTRVSQVLNNLVSNALKFTQDGKVMVLLAQPDENSFEITVKDTGIGISKEQLQLLFQPFQQADASTTREYGGTGLGLSITKNLCELMGGELKVFSDPGKGSTFIATFSATPVSEESHAGAFENGPDEAQSDTASSNPGNAKQVVVIAEDNAINQEVLKAMLSSFNFEIHLAGNGKDAVALVEFLNPDLVLMDVHMPLMDGVEATRTIRERGHQMPIIMQTANVMTEDVAQYMQIGANDVIAKPIVQKQLTDTLKKWL